MKKILFITLIFSNLVFTQNIDFEGFMNFSYSNDSGKIHLEVNNLDKEFLYINSLSRGIGNNDLGLDRGQLGNTRIVFFTKRGNKILMVQPNTRYVSNSDNYLENKAVEEAFARSVLFSFEIIEEKNNNYIIDLTPLLINDAHGVSQRLKDSNSGNYSLNKSMSAIELDRTKAFPKNIEFDIMLTFSGTPSGSLISTVTPSPDAITLNQHHSFVALPDSNYKPRQFDPRSGANALTFFDYTTWNGLLDWYYY